MADLSPERRAEEAKRILEHPLFAEAIAHLYADIERQRRKASAIDSDLHTRLVLAEQLAAKVEKFLRREIETGEIVALHAARTITERVLRR